MYAEVVARFTQDKGYPVTVTTEQRTASELQNRTSHAKKLQIRTGLRDTYFDETLVRKLHELIPNTYVFGLTAYSKGDDYFENQFDAVLRKLITMDEILLSLEFDSSEEVTGTNK